MVRKESHYFFKITSLIKDRYGEVTWDEMVRRISVICDKLNDALLREGKEPTETRENSGVRDGVVEEDDVSEGGRAEGGPSVEQIENFIFDIRQQVSMRDFGGDEDIEVEVEDISSEEILVDVNPLPVDCPLVLMD